LQDHIKKTSQTLKLQAPTRPSFAVPAKAFKPQHDRKREERRKEGEQKKQGRKKKKSSSVPQRHYLILAGGHSIQMEKQD